MAQVAKDRMGVHQRQVAVLVRDEKLVWSEISVQEDPNNLAFYLKLGLVKPHWLSSVFGSSPGCSSYQASGYQQHSDGYLGN